MKTLHQLVQERIAHSAALVSHKDAHESTARAKRLNPAQRWQIELRLSLVLRPYER